MFKYSALKKKKKNLENTYTEKLKSENLYFKKPQILQMIIKWLNEQSHFPFW